MIPTRSWSSQFLVAVQCALALRHLKVPDEAAITTKLNRTVNEHLCRALREANPSQATVEALLILGLWSPVAVQPQAEPHNGQLLIRAAVSYASSFRKSELWQRRCATPQRSDNHVQVEDNIHLVSLLAANIYHLQMTSLMTSITVA